MLQTSVVVPTHNRRHLVIRCLKALDRQTLNFGAFEVLVVNDGSTDDTLAHLERFAPQRYELRILDQQNGGPAAARNLGVASARSDLVAFVDDDCEPEPEWLRTLVEHMRAASEEVAGCGGDTRAAVDGLVPRYLDRIGVLCPRVDADTVLYLITCNAIFKRSAVLSVGGFDEAYRVAGGEDPELCGRLRRRGHRFTFEPRARLRHLHPTTFRGLFRMYRRYAKGLAVADERGHGWSEPERPSLGHPFLRHFSWPNGKTRDIPGFLLCESIKITAVGMEIVKAHLR